jgi:hypothetical protein
MATTSRRAPTHHGDRNDEQVSALLVQLSTFARGKINEELKEVANRL